MPRKASAAAFRPSVPAAPALVAVTMHEPAMFLPMKVTRASMAAGNWPRSTMTGVVTPGCTVTGTVARRAG